MTYPTSSSHQPPYQNGNHRTPLAAGGVSTAAKKRSNDNQRTVFEPDAPPSGWYGRLYACDRFELGGTPVTRWLLLAWLALAGIWAMGIFPLRWVGVGFFLALFVAHIWFIRRLRREDFVEFHPQTVPPLAPEPMPPRDKLPIYATGQLSVESKFRRYTWLPGFFRTFATGEHAIMCQVRKRRWLGLLHWPEDEIGMWYAFIWPANIQHLRWGTLHFGAVTAPAIAVGYQWILPPEGRRKEEKILHETLYLSFDDEETGAQVYTNLLQRLPDEAVVAGDIPESVRSR